jgi:hypothetical protein
MSGILLRRMRRIPYAIVYGTFLWMGLVIRRVTSPQMKHEVRGGKLPVSLSTRRSRGSRGSRKGRARGRQPRCSPNPSPTTRKTHGGESRPWPEKPQLLGYVQKARARRMRYIESRFCAILVARNRDKEFLKEVPASSCRCEYCSQSVSMVVQKLWKLRLKKFEQHLASRNYPTPPLPVGRWFEKWVEMKYGTWADVHSALVDGEHAGSFGIPPPMQISTSGRRRPSRRGQSLGRRGQMTRAALSGTRATSMVQRPPPCSECGASWGSRHRQRCSRTHT